MSRYASSPAWIIAAILCLLMNVAAGRLLDAGFTYAYVFAIVGTLHVIAFAVILVAIPRIQPPSGYAVTTQT